MNDLTVGKPAKVLLKLTLPMFLSVIFQQMYNIADSIIAGRFAGENALAAIGASYPITMMFMSVAFGCNIGCTVVISRFFGEKNYEDMKCCISTTMISTLTLSAILTAVGLFFSSNMMRMIHTPDNIFAGGELFLNIYFYGLPFLFLYNVVTGVFTSLGDSKTPLYFLIASSIGNIVLDYIFVAWFDLGIAGVAWATFIAQGLAGILSAARLFFVVKSIKCKKFKYFSLPMLGKLSIMAIPSILQQSFISVGNILVQSVINPFGAPVIAGYSAGIKLNMFATTSFINLGNGMCAFAAQNLGAKKPERINKGFFEILKMTIILVIPFFAGYFFFGGAFVNLFLKNPTHLAMKTGMDMLKVISPFYFLVSVKIISDNVLRGVGNMKAFMLSTFSDLLLRVVFSFVLTEFMGVSGVFWAWSIGWIIGTAIAVWLWLREKKNLNERIQMY